MSSSILSQLLSPPLSVPSPTAATLLVGAVVASLGVTLTLVLCRRRKDNSSSLIVPTYEKDHVYLIQFKPSALLASSGDKKQLSSSPHCAKVEMFLIYHKIPYTSITNQIPPNMKYKKFPAIELNGEATADSASILSRLSSHFCIDMDANLTAHERGISHTIWKTLDEHLYFCCLSMAWQDDNGWRDTKAAHFAHEPWFLRNIIVPLIIRPSQIDRVKKQGVGMFEPKMIAERSKLDVQAVSDILGDRKWLLGKDAPSLVDIVCAAYLNHELGGGAQTPLTNILVTEFPNLVAYSNRAMQVFLS